MKKRSGFNIMLRLIGLVRPLAPYMVLAIAMGLIGHLCATFITVFGGFAVTGLLGPGAPLSLTGIFIAVAVFALLQHIHSSAHSSGTHGQSGQFLQQRHVKTSFRIPLYGFGLVYHTLPQNTSVVFFHKISIQELYNLLESGMIVPHSDIEEG